jgi:hypothetical protein
MHSGLDASTDLQLRCKDWPSQVVARAVHTVLYGAGRAIETLAISDLVGRWMTGEFEFVPPPLSRDLLAAIRRELERHVN